MQSMGFKTWIKIHKCVYLSYGSILTISDILSSYRVLNHNENIFVFQFFHPQYSQLIINQVKPVYPENELKRTQDLKPVYFDCGQFYWGTKENWLNSSKIHSNGLGYICQIGELLI